MAEEKQNTQKPILARRYKDSVFTHLFRQPEYTLQLYQALHPEDTETTIADIRNVTHDNILVKDIYNDLGFCVRDKLIILVESQRTWSLNIVVRAFLYLSRTYEDYLSKHELNLYGTKKITLPEPELYVVYTKQRKDEPEVISLKNDFFNGKETAVDIKVKVLFGENRESIIGQYVSFCKILDEQVAIHGPTKESIEETIHICREQNILTEYLKNFELEVVEMTDYLFNEEVISEAYKKSIRDEGISEGISMGRAEGISVGRAEGISMGRAEGISMGRAEGISMGRAEGISMGRAEGAQSVLDSLVSRGIISRQQAEGEAKQFRLM